MKFVGNNSDTIIVNVSVKSVIALDSTCLYCTEPRKIETITVKLTDITSITSGNKLAEFELLPPTSTDNSIISLYLLSVLDDYISPRYVFDLKTLSNNNFIDCSLINYDCSTFLVNGFTYSDAVKISNTPRYPTLNEITNIIYTKAKGIILFTFENGTIYSII